MLGFDAEGKPVNLEWGQAGVYAVAGRSGSGKTSLVRFLLAQAAMVGIKLVVCDPHASSEQSLAASCESLKAAFLCEPASSNEDILDTIHMVDEIGRKRIDGEDKSIAPILLVIDEFSSIMLNSENAKEISKLLVNMANEYRKVGIQALLIGQSWKHDMSGGTTLRSALGGSIVMNIQPPEAAFLTTDEKTAKKAGVNKLQKGEAIVFLNGKEVRIQAPYIRSDDVAGIAQYIPASKVAPETRSGASVTKTVQLHSRKDIIRYWLSQGKSKNEIYEEFRGNRQKFLQEVEAIEEEDNLLTDLLN